LKALHAVVPSIKPGFERPSGMVQMGKGHLEEEGAQGRERLRNRW
jgi:hypothetical protein